MNKENSNVCESSEDEDYSRSLSYNSDKDSIEKKLPDKCLQSDTQQNYTSCKKLLIDISLRHHAVISFATVCA